MSNKEQVHRIPNWRDWKSCKNYQLLFTSSRRLTDAEQKELYEGLTTMLGEFTAKTEKLYISPT